MEAKKFIEVLCPIGSDVLFDQDDLQPLDRYYGGVGIMGTPLGVVYCNGLNLNEELTESKYDRLVNGFVTIQNLPTVNGPKRIDV